jgi:cyclopropane fatty-acyl-phospholipid synthase-like methyltransferase
MDTKRMSESAEYWKEHLLSWEASAYYKDTQRKVSFWDRLSTLFRGDAMYVRMNTALELLKPYLAGKRVLDVGCASGRFAAHLLNAGAAEIYGVDISPEAIQIANDYRVRAGLEDRLHFSLADVVHSGNPLPPSDLVTALGVIEYFDARAMSAFLGNLQTEYFFLDFPDMARKKQFPTWQLRQVYIRVHKLPGVYLYRLEEFTELAKPFGFKDIRLTKRNGFYYITNLPKE